MPWEKQEDRRKESLPGGAGRPRRALVLAGGGIPGWMYEIGCLTALDDFFDGFSVNDFDIYVGTSAGAAVAALIANGVKPRAIYDDIKNDRKTPFNFAQRDIYSFGYQETFHILKKFLRSLFPIMKYYFKNKQPVSILDLLLLLQENLPSGIFTLKNFDLYLSRFFSQEGYTNDFRKLKRELYIPAVDVDMARYDVFGEKEFSDVSISQAVIASAAMPILFQPVRINGKDYIDGGVGRVAYMDIAMNHGADLIWVVNPVQYIVNDRKRVRLSSLAEEGISIKEKGLYSIYDQAMRINTATRIYLALKRYVFEHPGKHFILTQPKPSEATMFAHHAISYRSRVEVLRYGYCSTMEALKEEFPYYRNCLGRHRIQVTVDKFKEP
ncbi:MAG TPA: patatin-like phospholipase family protein [Candidatus Manganitrophaceae bacterium]|nr:patatin-like phospholipase family protein [Candidatus Manganitrophaceae bacterium]